MNREDRMYKLSQGTPTAVWAYNRILLLEAYIESSGEEENICTKLILGRVCSYCQCNYRVKEDSK